MNFDHGIPIWLQLRKTFALLIANNTWKPGTQTPSVRELASQYGVNPNTIQKALSELETDGYLETKRGLGRFVINNETNIQKLRFELAAQAAQNYVRKIWELGLNQESAQELLNHTWAKNKNK